MALAKVSFSVLLPGCPIEPETRKLLWARALGAGLGGLASSQLLQRAGGSHVLTLCVLGPRMGHQDVCVCREG